MRENICVVHSTPRRTPGPCGNVLVLGYQSCVGQALLNVLADTDIGRDIVGRIDTLALIDEQPSDEPSVSTRVRVLNPQRIETHVELSSLLAALGVDQLIDLSDLDPLECIRGCAQAGVDCALARAARDPLAFDAASRARLTQVTAAAVVAGWKQLGRIAGLHFVEEIDPSAHVETGGPAPGWLRATNGALLLE